MVKKKSAPAGKKGVAKPAEIVIVDADQAVREVRFGAVTVSVGKLDSAVAARNVERGRAALKRASMALAKPGFVLKKKKGVPYFHADPKHPNRVIRELNGQKASGVFEGGEFKTIDT